MWLTTRTRPDIAACLGILASMMVATTERTLGLHTDTLPCLSLCQESMIATARSGVLKPLGLQSLDCILANGSVVKSLQQRDHEAL